MILMKAGRKKGICMKRLVVLFLALALVWSVSAGMGEGLVMENNHRVFYEIFVGSFSDSNGDGIGDLADAGFPFTVVS